MEGIRYANIGIGVGTAVIVAGVLVFKDSNEAVMQATALIGLFVALAISNVLYERAKRRDRKRSQ